MPPFLTQPVKTQNPFKGELGHGVVEKEVCGEDDIRIVANVRGAPNGAEYHWSVNGQPAAGGSTLRLGEPQPGRYFVVLRVSGPPGYAAGQASTSFTVLPENLPSGTISADPSEMEAGHTSALTVRIAPRRCGGPITVSLAASEGKISGMMFESDGVRFESAQGREQSKSVIVTATFQDVHGRTTVATTSILVRKPPEAFHMTDLLFGKNDAKVNACGKRVLLENLPALLAQNPDAQVLLVGHSAVDEAHDKDQQRVTDVAATLSAGKGSVVGLAGRSRF